MEKADRKKVHTQFSRCIEKQSGFSMLEMVIYVTLLSVISVVAVSGILAMTKTFANIRVSRDLTSSAILAVERVVRDTRSAYEVDVAGSVFGSTPGHLTIKADDGAGGDTVTEFYVDSGRLMVSRDSVEVGALTSKNTTVDSVTFYHVTNANTEAVRIELQITASRGAIQKTKSFYNTVILRGSY